MRALATLSVVLGLAACGAPNDEADAGSLGSTDSGQGALVDSGVPPNPDAGDPFADRVVRFAPGPGSGFGVEHLPTIVLGAPRGAGAGSGSLDVVSLGREGVIELELTDFVAIDGPGVDLVVFENAFTGFVEAGAVSVSDDGVTWAEFPCRADLGDAGTEGCAGLAPVYSSPDNGISPIDFAVSGGDGFDLHDVGLARARFVRIRDLGTSKFYAPPSGGFDLDAVAVINTTHL